MARPLRVMMLTHEYPPDILGGLGTHVAELARGLDRAGHHVDVVVTTLTDAPRDDAHADGASGVRVYHAPVVGKSRANDAAARALAVADETGATPDVVHCHDLFFLPAGQRLRRKWKCPLVGTAHLLEDAIADVIGEPRTKGRGMFEKMFCTTVDRLITVSEAMRSLCCEAHELDRARVDVVHNGFDPAAFARADAGIESLRDEYAPNGEKVIVYAGRLCRQKGVLGLLGAMERVVSARPDTTLVLAGEPINEEFEAVWSGAYERAQSRLSDAVRWVGQLPRPDLARLYGVADVAVVPSLYEPFGYAAVEAMAAATPLVASDVGGLPEIATHEEHALLVPLDRSAMPHSVDEASLARAIIALLESPERAARMAQAGRERALSFTVERMVEGTLESYRRASSS